jgi:hypothetical protein
MFVYVMAQASSSFGVKGARIGSGPRGNYIHLGEEESIIDRPFQELAVVKILFKLTLMNPQFAELPSKPLRSRRLQLLPPMSC